MLSSIFATKHSMTQAWDTKGKRLAVTKCKVGPNLVFSSLSSENNSQDSEQRMLIIGYGDKKLSSMKKPLQAQLKKSGFSFGVRQLQGVSVSGQEEMPKVGNEVKVEEVLQVGDIVKVQGTTKGRGFAGAMKRHGFSGGPRTHGQSDRERAVGSIGSGTTPGRVWKGKKMPGHYGVETKTVTGLIVLHVDVDHQEVWLSGPIPGSINSIVKIRPTGKTKKVELNLSASGINPDSKEQQEQQVKE